VWSGDGKGGGHDAAAAPSAATPRTLAGGVRRVKSFSSRAQHFRY
jgi:hypothetical protein